MQRVFQRCVRVCLIISTSTFTLLVYIRTCIYAATWLLLSKQGDLLQFLTKKLDEPRQRWYVEEYVEEGLAVVNNKEAVDNAKAQGMLKRSTLGGGQAALTCCIICIPLAVYHLTIVKQPQDWSCKQSLSAQSLMWRVGGGVGGFAHEYCLFHSLLWEGWERTCHLCQQGTTLSFSSHWGSPVIDNETISSIRLRNVHQECAELSHAIWGAGGVPEAC